jgi:DNA-directed RNA polymerase specialized sigma24 family protein
MIDYINARCNQWVLWHRRGQDNGLGFPRECAYTRLDGRTPGKVSQPPVDEAAWEIERAVRALEHELNKVVIQFYLKRGTSEDKARACQCHRDTLYARLHTAHIRILEWLNDETAGVPHQVVKQKFLHYSDSLG